MTLNDINVTICKIIQNFEHWNGFKDKMRQNQVDLSQGGQRFTGVEHKPLHDRWFSMIARLPIAIQLVNKWFRCQQLKLLANISM